VISVMNDSGMDIAIVFQLGPVLVSQTVLTSFTITLLLGIFSWLVT